MARPEILEGGSLSFPHLYSEVQGSCGFTLDRLIEMISTCDDNGEDFTLIHGNTRYVVSLDEIRKYFQQHKKPERELSAEQEVKFLRAEVDRLKKEARKGEFSKTEATPVTSTEEEEEALTFDPDPVATISGSATSIPPKDPEIPRSDRKMSVEEIQADLKAQLVQKKPDIVTKEKTAAAVARKATEK